MTLHQVCNSCKSLISNSRSGCTYLATLTASQQWWFALPLPIHSEENTARNRYNNILSPDRLIQLTSSREPFLHICRTSSHSLFNRFTAHQIIWKWDFVVSTMEPRWNSQANSPQVSPFIMMTTVSYESSGSSRIDKSDHNEWWRCSSEVLLS